jgi:hypothetical protein
MRWAGHVARIRKNRNAYRVLVGNPEGKSTLGRLRPRFESHIKMDIREIGWGCVLDSSGSCEHDNEPSGFIKCWQFGEWLSNYWLLKKDSAVRS